MLLADHHKIALTLPGISLTYAQLLAAAHSYASLFAAGTKRVLIFSENRPEWIYALYAAWCNQSTVVPVAIQGAYEALPAGSILLRPFRTISVQSPPDISPGPHLRIPQGCGP